MDQTEEPSTSGRPADSSTKDDGTVVRITQRVYRACIRGFAIGLVLRGGLHAVSSTVQTLRGKRISERFPAQWLDAGRWAAALAMFGSVYVVADESIRHRFGNERSATWRAAVAGAAAGPSILLTGAAIRRDELALYFLLRGATLLIRCGNKAPEDTWLHKALVATRWKHGDSAMMCAATWQILFSYLMMPTTLPKGYIKFLDRMAGFDSWLIPVARELALRNVASPAHRPQVLARLPQKFTPAVANSDFCGMLHPTQPDHCNKHFAGILPLLFSRSLAVYLPVYTASTLAVQRGRLLKRPQLVLSRMLLGIGRSSTFLAIYVAVAHRVICWANRLKFSGVSGLTPARIALVAWIPGLATLLEKKSRRMELALYCCCRAMLSFYQTLFVTKVAPRWLLRIRTDVVVFSLATAAIMHCYSDAMGQHRDIFRSKYLNVLDFMFGGVGIDEGNIMHATSNRELIWRAHNATKVHLRSLSSASLQNLRAAALTSKQGSADSDDKGDGSAKAVVAS